MGHTLPAPGPARGVYSPVAQARGIAFVSAQGPFRDGAIAYRGRVGAETDPESARDAARLAALNVLAQLHAACGGSLEGVRRCLQVNVHVASADDFFAQPAVADAASELLVAAFGAEPAPARTSLGAARLPGDCTVLIDAVFELKE